MHKKILSLLIAVVLISSTLPVINAQEIKLPSFITAETQGLFAHGTNNSEDSEAWQCWQNKMEENYRGDPVRDKPKEMLDVEPNVKYFFMPSGSEENKAEVYNGFDQAVTINSTTITPKTTAVVEYKPDTAYNISLNDESYTLTFKKSTAEAAIYVNNPDADGNDTELYKYLYENKSNSASATAALINSDGTVDNTAVKKIKGRGNTTWKKEKKPFNITYQDSVSIAGMAKGKKFTLLANYQDGALIRNRLLYDLSDAVGLPYASDSRFADLYMNGVYYGSYQICQKIEVGKNDLINDIDDEAYLKEDGTVATNFPFLMEIDPSASEDDFNFTASNNSVTVKAPELSADDPNYSKVKFYVSNRFTALYNALRSNATKESLNSIMDIDSFAKIYLINELGKNWDSGASSFYMVYKQDAYGKWKFFASPVWDYDNSLGNCKGVQRDLENMKMSPEQYLSPTGWWCIYKGKSNNSAVSSKNICNRIASCKYIQEYSSLVWFDEFVPALKTLTSKNINSGEIYSADVYYELLKGTADCNYTRGWFLDTNDEWIADHDKLIKGTYDESANQYVEDTAETTYPVSFKGEFDYCIDWLTSRSNWLSAQLKPNYFLMGDTTLDGNTDINDVTQIQRIVASYTSTDKQIQAADTNKDFVVDIRDATHLQRKLAGLI